jgi:flagellar biosynthesis/type III secretory pathway M-ring protein FliF/YscJ
MKYVLKGDDMEKWKELSKRKKFIGAVAVLVVIAVVGWVSGWWSSPPAA